MRIRVNKIASVTRRLDLGYELILTKEIDSREGAVVAGRVLNDKTTYNTLEDVHGRMSKLKSGDVIVGVLGHRQALHGYEGVVPETLAAGDTVQILNLGGVVGRCISYNPTVGPPFDVQVMGQVLLHPVFQSRKGEPASIAFGNGGPPAELDRPLVVVCGACMDSGKTAAASAIVSGLSGRGARVGAAKLTGVSLMRDILALKDYGAVYACDFTDVGYPSTGPASAPVAARRIFGRLAEQGLDVVVAEMGDGIFGQYGVQQILADTELARLASVHVYCASDPAGAYGGVRELKERYNIDVDVVSGPVTDNLVGSRFVKESLGIAAINAQREPAELAEHIYSKLHLNLEHGEVKHAD